MTAPSPGSKSSPSPPGIADLGDRVDLWPLDLDRLSSENAGATGMLSADETARAGRFRFDRDRRRFIAGRAALRRILALYLESDAASLSFSYGPAGKPALSEPLPGRTLSFNLSHSHHRGLLAITRGRELGIDLERIGSKKDLAAIAERFFARGEITALADLGPDLFEQGFFACWTRKEALLKAFGDGLRLPLDGFCVSVDPQAPAKLISTAFRPAEAERWSLIDLSAHPAQLPDFRSALAIEGPAPDCRYFEFSA